MITLAAISLAAPLMLLGVAAVALPILAHLINRRTRQRVVFPTIRLLAETKATQSSLYRVRRWVLLALRCLAVAMVALAFTMPSCTPTAAPNRNEDSAASGASVVLLLDVSVSINRDVEGVNLVNTMRAVAQRALSTLVPGEDRANIVYAGAKPRTAFAHQKGQMSLSANLDAVREFLQSLAATEERADLPAAIAIAGEMLKDAPGQKRVVIITDMQQSNWSDVSLTGDAAALLPPGTVVTVLPLETGKPANIALSDVRAEPLKPIVNQPSLLIAKAKNHTSEAKEVTVSASLDGQPIGVKAVQLNAGESRDVGFEAMIATPGRHRVEFSLGDDAFTADNRAYLAVHAVQRVPIFIVGDDNPAELGTASYFLSRALSPRGDTGDLLEVRHMTSADLADADLAQAEALFIGQVAQLSPQACGAVVTYLKRGGGVVLFSGDGPVRENFAAIQAAMAKQTEDGRETPQITPWQLAEHRDLTTTGAFLRITDGEWSSELLTEFDEQSRAAIGQIRFFKAWSIAQMNPAAKALLTFSDKTPAVAVLPVGEGRLVAASFSPALAATDFGKYGSFVAFTHSLARYIRPKRDWRSQATVGQPILASAAIPAGEGPGRLLVEGPAGAMFTPEHSRVGTRMNIAVDRSPAAGFYRVLRNDQPVSDVAVNIDARESDLRALTAEEIARQLKTTGTTVEVKGQSTEGNILDVRGQPLWHWFVLLAMVMIGLELALLAVWNR